MALEVGRGVEPGGQGSPISDSERRAGRLGLTSDKGYWWPIQPPAQTRTSKGAGPTLGGCLYPPTQPPDCTDTEPLPVGDALGPAMKQFLNHI